MARKAAGQQAERGADGRPAPGLRPEPGFAVPPRPNAYRAKKTTAAYVERRAAILGAAGEVFYEKGYRGASMQDVADRAGILKPALYYYFGSKEDLLFELAGGEWAVRFMEEFLEADEALRDSPAATRLEAFITRWVACTEPRNPAFLAAEREFRQLSGERLEVTIAVRRRLPSLLESILQRGVEDGSFDSATIVRVAAKDIAAMLSNLYVWYQPTGPCTIDDLTNWYIKLILRGIGHQRS